MTKRTISLALVTLLGTASVGCDDESWYADWYDTLDENGEAVPVVVGDPDPNYSSAYFDLQSPLYTEVGYLGCLTADEQDAYGLTNAGSDAHYWYSYIEFLGLANAGTSTVYSIAGEGVAVYAEWGGSTYADYGYDDAGDYYFADYFYSENAAPVANCAEEFDLAIGDMVIAITDLAGSTDQLVVEPADYSYYY